MATNAVAVEAKQLLQIILRAVVNYGKINKKFGIAKDNVLNAALSLENNCLNRLK